MKHCLIALIGWLLLGCRLLSAQPSYTCQYWFDGNYNARFDTTVTTGHWQALVETSHLPFGLHTLYMHLQDTSGRWTAPRSFLFYRTQDTLSIHALTYTCWFDQDRSTLQQGNLGSGHMLLEASTLNDRFHTFNLQIGNGAMARLLSFMFYKMPTSDSVGSNMTYSCWFDQDRSTLQQGNIGDGALLIDVAAIDNGLHTFNLQLGDGKTARLQSFLFYKVPTTDSGGLDMTYSCWFDQDRNGTLQQGNISDGALLIDVAAIAGGLHIFNLQLGDGKTARLHSFLFYKVPVADSGGLDMTYSCWFDQDTSTMQSGNVANGHLLIDAADISVGMHTLNFQLNAGSLTQLQSYMFYRMPILDTGTAQMVYRCWFDQDYTTLQQGNIGNGHLLIETASLSDGLHTLNIELGSGKTARLSSHLFYRIPVQGSSELAGDYSLWFDQDYSTLQQGNIAGGHLLIETSSLPDGLHTLNIQLSSGRTARLSSHLFMKMESLLGSTDTTPLSWHYSIDGRDYPPISVSRNGGLIHLDVDVSTIPEGLHTLSHFMTTQQGTTFGVNSSLFYKIPVGGNGVKRYEYWFNDDYANRVTAVLDTVADPFRLVQLLDVDTLPFRSMSFQFDPNGGSPRCYAKNKIDFRFWDGMSRYVSRSAEFVDQRVMQVVTADTLERDTTKVIPVPNSNAIHWFKLYAGVGDSLSFHTDRHCTMQLFAPSGEEVFSASGQDVLTWHGCHSWEDGVYYLAVHDAKGTGNISVSYQWIYRYAVLAWDVHRVGNGGISTITFEGNGFNNLDTVFLFKGTDTISALYLDHESNTTVSVIFNFEGADTGMYHAIFVYVDENLSKPSVVNVENAIPIVLTSTCSYPSTFLRGSTVTYTYTVTNTGNMTAYNVPLYTYIGSPSLTSISHIKYEGLNLPPITSNINIDSLLPNDITELQEWAEQVGDDHYFYKLRTYDSISGDSIWVRSNYFFFTLAPYETMTLALNLKTSETVDVWFTIADTMAPLVIIEHNTTSKPIPSYYGKSFRNNYCCVKEGVECMVNFTANMLDLTSTLSSFFPGAQGAAIALSVASCVASATNTVLPVLDKFYCQGIGEDIDMSDLIAKTIPSIIGTALSCISLHLSGAAKLSYLKNTIRETYKQISFILSLGTVSLDVMTPSDYNCISRFINSDPYCPPRPPQGGKSSPQAPVDPNEITGFIAESGSHAVCGELTQLPYMIEFENDTVFATAHAHTVVVRDTLNGNVFDLNSFSATAFSIGDEITTINGGQNFTRTVDMRPTIDALAQVQLDYRVDTSFAVATWTFTSLDPMTLLPAADSLGFLGIGKTGEVDFTINRKADLPDSTLIDNRAWIVFDNEEPIATSTWRNIIDNTPPMSIIDSITYSSNTATVTINATDNLSGVWRYNVYALMDGDVLLPMAMNVLIDSAAVFTTPDEVAQFRSTAIDSAGNVEPLVLTPLITTVYDTLTITACDNYTWGDSLYTVSGEYTKSKTAMLRNAPDTLSTLFLTVNHSTTATESATACDSYTWHGTAYTTSTNTPTYSTTNVQGCDSTVTLSLIINNSSTSVESITACDSYTWHGNAYTASTNTPTYSTTNAQGCDSTVTLHLTVNNSSTGIDVVNACNSFTWHGTTYTVSTNTPTYTSLNAAGCDSVTTLHLTINQSLSSIDAITACDSYTWNGTTYTSSTFTPTYSTTSTQGCDSTVTLHLTIKNSTTAIENATACDSYTWHGTAYTASTNTPTYSTTNAQGCDSTITLHLTINNSTTAIETATACDSYTWHGNAYTASTNTPTYSTTNAYGCDSTITLHLTINNSTTAIETATACDSYTWHDSVYTASTLNSQFSTLNSQGCDSTITLHLTINNSTTAIETATACDSYTWHDSVYTASTSDAHFSTLNSAGCDSTVTLHLTINYSTHDTIVDSAVGSYTWHGNTYTESGEYSFESLTEDGCDSVIVLQLTINEVGISTVDSLGHITLYPNPTTGWVTIVHDGVSSVDVFDQSGCCIATFHGTSLFNIKDLPTGVYTLRITYQGGSAVKRIIKH